MQVRRPMEASLHGFVRDRCDLVRIRPARADEATVLSDLCCTSKAVWRYDEAFMALAASALEVKVAAIAAGDVWVAELGGSARWRRRAGFRRGA